MFCPNCGKQIKDGRKFCTFCGVNIAEEAEPHTEQVRWQSSPAPLPNVPVRLPSTPVPPPKKQKMPGSVQKVIIFTLVGGVVLGGLVSFLLLFGPLSGDKKADGSGNSGAAQSTASAPDPTSATAWTPDELKSSFQQSNLQEMPCSESGIEAIYQADNGGHVVCTRQENSSGTVLAAVYCQSGNNVSSVQFRAEGFAPEEIAQIQDGTFTARFAAGKLPGQVSVTDAGSAGDCAKQAVVLATDYLQQAGLDIAPSSPLYGMKPLQSVKVYNVRKGAKCLRLRAQPNTDAQIVDLMWENDTAFYYLTEKDGWAYGAYLGQMGWCSTEWLDSSNLYTLELPSFLTLNQQVEFAQAYSLSKGLAGGHYGCDTTKPTKVPDHGVLYPTKYFMNKYDHFQAVVEDNFCSKKAKSDLLSRYVEYKNGLYCGDGAGGSLPVVWYEYISESQTADRITFTLKGHYYSEFDGDYTKEWPIEMVRGDDGNWRFETIADPYFGSLG